MRHRPSQFWNSVVVLLAILIRGPDIGEGRAMHQPSMWQRVVLDCPMLNRAIIPDEQIARLPLMSVNEFGSRYMVGQRRYQQVRFFLFHAFDTRRVVPHDV